VSTKSRVDFAADVPTVAEQGLYDYDMALFYGSAVARQRDAGAIVQS